MSVVSEVRPAPAHRRTGLGRLPLTVLAGLVVGAGASTIFAVLLAAIAVNAQFPRLSLPAWTLALTIMGLTLTLGVLFGLLAAAGRQEPPVWWRTLLIGASLPLAGLGGLMLALRLEPLGTSQPALTLPIFRVAFVSASGLTALVCTLVAAWTFKVPHSLRLALEIALITALVYLLFALALDLIPGFHVGGGDRAMPKVAALCNLLAGMIGGSFAYRALTR